MKYVVVGAIFGLLFLAIRNGWLRNLRLPALPGGWISLDFLLNVGALILGVLVLEYAIYQTDKFPGMFNTWGGLFGQLAFYMLVAVAIVVSQTRHGKVRQIAFYLVIAGCVVIGVHELGKAMFGKEEVALTNGEQQAANDAARREAIVEASKPARSDECPGTTPTEPFTITTDWHTFAHPCEVTWKVFDGAGRVLSASEVEFDPPAGIPKRVRLKAGSGSMYAMYCPAGF